MHIAVSPFARKLRQGSHGAQGTGESGELAALVAVPWHGGPDYFNQYTNPGILSDSSKIPIFEWYGNVDISTVDAEKACGINGFLVVTAPTDLSVVRNAGLYVVPAYGEYTGTPGTETVGWHGDDEVDMRFPVGWNVGQGFEHLQTLVAGYPNDGRNVHNNFGKGVMYWASNADAATYVNGGDLTGNWRQGSVSSDLYWYAGVQELQGDGALYLNRSANQIARAQNYGWMIDRQRTLQNVGSYNTGPKPIYGFVETSHPYGNGGMPTPDQVEGAAWNSFIHGAAGVFYFHHSFIDPPAAWSASTQYNLGSNVTYGGNVYTAANLITPTIGIAPNIDSAWVGPIYESSVGLRNPMVPGMTAKLADLYARVQALAPVLNSQSYEWVANVNLETMLKKPGDGFVYVFAMQTIDNETGSYTISLPSGINGSSVSVVDESRTLTASFGTYEKTFYYTGNSQSWTVPAGVTSVTIDVYGAEGGTSGPSTAGLGGHVRATITVNSGETYQINVGGQGQTGSGGWNGGGDAPIATLAGGGGGASDIRFGGTNLANRILVAGGGGGVGDYGNGGTGGNGGGLSGSDGGGTDPGAGGTQVNGGAGMNGGSDGVLGLGGSTTSDGGGGGGGYYGGGGGGWYKGGGGGGSSYIQTGTNTLNEAGINSGHGRIVITTPQIPSENKTFTDTFDAEYTCHIYKIAI